MILSFPLLSKQQYHQKSVAVVKLQQVDSAVFLFVSLFYELV